MNFILAPWHIAFNHAAATELRFRPASNEHRFVSIVVENSTECGQILPTEGVRHFLSDGVTERVRIPFAFAFY